MRVSLAMMLLSSVKSLVVPAAFMLRYWTRRKRVLAVLLHVNRLFSHPVADADHSAFRQRPVDRIRERPVVSVGSQPEY